MTFYEENSYFFYLRKDLIETIISKASCNLQYDFYANKLYVGDKRDRTNRDSWYKEYYDTFLFIAI